MSRTWVANDDLRLLEECPVLARVADRQHTQWLPANKTYFGSDWGENGMPLVYQSRSDIAWVVPLEGTDEQRQQTTLGSLGVTGFPRVAPEKSQEAIAAEDQRIDSELPHHTARGKTEPPLVFDRVEVANLAARQSRHLITMLARNWRTYYYEQHQIHVNYQYYGWHPHPVPALWWTQVLRHLVPPLKPSHAGHVALAEAWLPDRPTMRAVGDLLPVIDLDAFGKDAPTVAQWLVEVVRVRQSLQQMSVDEWRGLLSKSIPRATPTGSAAADPARRDMVVRWYEACVESLEQREDAPEGALAGVPLLCQKGEQWDYRAEEPVWLADDNDLACAFRDDCWQIELRMTLRIHAKSLFRLRSLSDHTTLLFLAGALDGQRTMELQRLLCASRSFVFVWRCSQTKEQPERVRTELDSMRVAVVEGLRATLKLDGVGEKTIQRTWGVPKKQKGQERQLLIDAHFVDSGISALAHAMAEALGVKTDADLYENLLHCPSDAEREAKLLSKGITRAGMDRLLRLFDLSEEVPIGPGGPIGAGPAPTGGVTERSAIESAYPSERSPYLPLHGGTPGHEQPSQTGKAEKEPESELALKDPQTAEIVCIETPQATGRSTIHPAPTGGGGWEGSTSLTQEQRNQIEDCGRAAAERELTRMGYLVTQMPRENPGFDIRATKAESELRVEVKAHRATSAVVEITVREIEEYSQLQRHPSVRWQLWNVENLAGAASGPVTITRYDVIPDDALRERTLALDLRKCIPLSD